MRALIVDDSRATRHLLCVALKELGAKEVFEAGDGAAALALLMLNPNVDLIITDWHMPVMSGFDLLKHLRKSERYKSTPVIMSTSETVGENVVAALREGATNYIIKPFNRKHLEEKIGPLIKAFLADQEQKKSAVAQTGIVNEGEIGSIIQFFIQTRQTGCCDLEYANCVGKICLNEGQITGALYQLQRGEPAFFTCMSAKPRRYSFRAGHFSVPQDCAITRPSMALLMQALAKNDEFEKPHRTI